MACSSPTPEKEQPPKPTVLEEEKTPTADFYLQAAAYDNPTTDLPKHWTRFYQRLQAIVKKKDFEGLKAQLDKAVVTAAGKGIPAFEKYWNSLSQPWVALEQDLERAGAFDNKDESLFSIPFWVLRPCPQSDCWRLAAGTPLFAKANSEEAASDTLFVARPLDLIGAELAEKDWYRVIRPDSSKLYVPKAYLQSRKSTRQLAFEREGNRWRLFMWK